MMMYQLSRVIGMFVGFCTQRVRVTGLEHLPKRGGFILAANHPGHLDPYFLSTLLKRPICWMARREFFQNPLAAWFLRRCGAFSVNRQGVPTRAIRHALRLLEEKKAVGIFPEGEVTPPARSALHGGSMKRGVCLLARRSGCPIIPCVIRGTEHLDKIKPWLPFRRSRVEIRFGAPLLAQPEGLPRADDERLLRVFAERLRELGKGMF